MDSVFEIYLTGNIAWMLMHNAAVGIMHNAM
jgi:hypothetical protein